MRAALALLCLLAVGFVAATETSVAAQAQDYSEAVADEENMSLEDAENAPFVPNQSESDADEVADETAADEEESMVSDEESDAADELEGNTEFALEDGETAEAAEFSFAETDANANVETDAEKLPKKLAKVLKAPRALKKKQHRRHHRGAAFKFHPERLVQADTLKGEDPEMAKLNLALAAVKEDILSTNKQITDERKWVIAVAKIIASYNNKMKRVEGHIIALRKEMKSLYRKKKQIENLKLQKALEAKLKEATNELATLSSSLKHVAVKSNELNRSGSDLRATIAGIQAQLRKLRGQSIKKSRKPKAAVRGRKAGRKHGRKHGRKGGKKCGKGKRFSHKAKRCVPRKAKAFAVKKH